MPPPGFSDEAESYLKLWEADEACKAAVAKAVAIHVAIKHKHAAAHAAIIAKTKMLDAEALDWECKLTGFQRRCFTRQVKKKVEAAVKATKATSEAQAVAKFKRSAEYTKTIRVEAQKLTKKQLKSHKVHILQMASSHVFKTFISYFVHTKAKSNQLVPEHKKLLDKMMSQDEESSDS